MLPSLEVSKIRQMQQLAKPTSINLGLGQPMMETPEELRQVVNQTMQEDDLGYTQFAGVPELREAIAQDVCGSDGRMENVCLTVGTTEAFYAACTTLLKPGDEVLIPDPGFISYTAVSKILGAKPVPYPVLAQNGFSLHPDAIESRITEKTRVLVINSPNNPTGQIIPQGDLDRLKQLAEKHNFYILSEEVYNTIHYDTPAPSAWGDSDRVFVINGISKMYSMTGWRLGWIVGDAKLMKDIITSHHYMVACAPAIAQRILLRLYRDNKRIGNRIQQFVVSQYQRRRTLLLESVENQLGWEYVPPDGAFYLMLKIPESINPDHNSETFARALADSKDVITIPGNAFGREGEGYLRLSFAVTEETISEGINRIAKYAGNGALK